MSAWRRHLRGVGEWTDARSPRERAFLLTAGLAILAGVFVGLAWDPLAVRRAELELRAAGLEAELRGLETQAAEIVAAHQRDPDAEPRARRDELLRQNAELDARIQEHTVAMIPPAEVPRFLERLLEEQGGLELVRLESLGAEPLLETEAGSAGVYRHGFEVVVQGDYLGTLRYLRALEALPWSFFWEAFEYEVIEHPLGSARIRAWTLGAGEEWLGV